VFAVWAAEAGSAEAGSAEAGSTRRVNLAALLPLLVGRTGSNASSVGEVDEPW
jgi:hypothetical protein